MPVYALIISILIIIVCYLLHVLHSASKEKIVVLITCFNEKSWASGERKTSWEMFDSMIEAKAFVKTHSRSQCGCKYDMIRTIKIDKNLYR